MKSIFKNISFSFIFASVLSVFLFVGSPVHADEGDYVAEGNSFGTYFDNFLDDIEQFVIDTGLPKLKWDTYKDHGLLIKPFIKMGYDLTSNVFNAPDDDSDHTENIWTITPGVQAIHKSDLGVVGLAYEATFRWFSQFGDQNQVDNSFLVFANLFPTENIYIRFQEKLDKTSNTAGSSAFKPIDIRDNNVNFTVGFVQDENWTHEVAYKNFDRHFANSIARRYSYNENVFDYRLYRNLEDGIRVFTGVRLGHVDFDIMESRDTFYYEFPVGIEAKLIHDINLVGSVGLHHRNLENGNRNDLTHVVTNISLQKSFNGNKTSLDGGFYRRDIESSFASATTYDEKMWYTNLKHLVTPKLRARAGLYVGNRDFEERVLTGTRVVVLGRVFVTPPSQVKRDDDVFGVSLGMDYNVRKWLVVHADYQYNRRNSNISSLDYTENVLSLRTTIPL